MLSIPPGEPKYLLTKTDHRTPLMTIGLAVLKTRCVSGARPEQGEKTEALEGQRLMGRGLGGVAETCSRGTRTHTLSARHWCLLHPEALGTHWWDPTPKAHLGEGTQIPWAWLAQIRPSFPWSAQNP